MVIKLNKNQYAVKIVKHDDENLLMDDGDYHFGVTDFNKKIIYIANNLSDSAFEYTLLHEITHAVIESFGFLQVEWNDEIVADFMANYSTIIADNYNYIIAIMEGYDD